MLEGSRNINESFKGLDFKKPLTVLASPAKDKMPINSPGSLLLWPQVLITSLTNQGDHPTITTDMHI